MQNSPLVSVIIVNWNGLQYLDSCLQGLRKQSYKPFEIIVVDNGSIDGSLKFLEKNYPEVRVVINSFNKGFAGGNNDGIRVAKGELLAFLNNDTVTHPEWMHHLVRIIQSSPKIAGVCGKIYSLDKPDKVLFTMPKINPYTGGAVWVTLDQGSQPVDYLSGNAMMVKRNVVTEIGEMDEEYFAYYEDTDWCARMIRAGYELTYVPDAIIWHKQFGTAQKQFQFYQMERNRIRFVLKNFDLFYLIIFLLLYPVHFLSWFMYFLAIFRFEEILLVTKAPLWNIINLRKTIQARYRDHQRIKRMRAYNKHLPLRSLKRYHPEYSSI